jgi:signal transduction histidine kinase
MLPRLPLESSRSVVTFALIRLAISLGSLLLAVLLGLPYGGKLVAVMGSVAVPWGVAVLLLARASPDAALSPLIAAGDVAVLVLLEAVVPETYGAVRFAALFLIAVHAHFQGERRGLVVGLAGTLALVAGTAARGGGMVRGELLAFYEAVFVVSGTGSGLLLGRLRSAESASRLRARSVTRHTIDAERDVRRRVAQSIHDGPVQELIGLGMVLSAATQAAEGGQRERVSELLGEARDLTERNLRALRDEMVDLGPHAFQQVTFEGAIEDCLPVWQRRYGIQVLLQLERIELPPEVVGDLFHIAKEAVVNAGRHAEASTVSISLRTVGNHVELRLMDDGKGLGDVDPMSPPEPGHLGLASIRERTELLEGKLSIESSKHGTKLVVLAPLARRQGSVNGGRR